MNSLFLLIGLHEASSANIYAMLSISKRIILAWGCCCVTTFFTAPLYYTPVNGRKVNPLAAAVIRYFFFLFYIFSNVLSRFNMLDATDSQLIAYITF